MREVLRLAVVALGSCSATAWLLWPAPRDLDLDGRAPPAQASRDLVTGADERDPCADVTRSLAAREAELTRQAAELAEQAQTPATAPFPSPEWERPALDRAMADWSAACPALREAEVVIECSEYPCLVSAWHARADGPLLCDGRPTGALHVVRSNGLGDVFSVQLQLSPYLAEDDPSYERVQRRIDRLQREMRESVWRARGWKSGDGE